MSDAIYMQIGATDAGVIKVRGRCWRRVGEVAVAPDTFASDIDGAAWDACDSCETCIQLGTSVSFTATCSGTLEVIVNDNNYSDNTGSWEVEVSGVGSVTLDTDTPSAVLGTVIAGTTYTCSASGSIDMGCGTCDSDPDGNGGAIEHYGPDYTGFPCQGLKHYSLVAKIACA